VHGSRKEELDFGGNRCRYVSVTIDARGGMRSVECDYSFFLHYTIPYKIIVLSPTRYQRSRTEYRLTLVRPLGASTVQVLPPSLKTAARTPLSLTLYIGGESQSRRVSCGDVVRDAHTTHRTIKDCVTPN